MENLPCPYLSIDVDIFKLKKNNLEILNQNLFIKVLDKVEYPWQSGRRYYLNEESQTGNDYWITQLWNEVYGPYYLVDNIGLVEVNSYKNENQKAFVLNVGSAVKAVKGVKDISSLLQSLMLLGAVLDADFTIDDGVTDANSIKSQASGYGEIQKLQLVSKVIHLRKDVIDIITNETLNTEFLREFVHLLHHTNEALKKVFNNDSQFPFHLTDYEKLKIEPLPVKTIIPKIRADAQEPILYVDPNLEQLIKIVTHPDFKPARYTESEGEDNYSVYVSIREIKYQEKIAGVTQPLFYVGITTEEDPIERYKNEKRSTLVGDLQNFEIVARFIDKNTARGIEQILILLNNNGSSYPSESKSLDNQRNSTYTKRIDYMDRLIKGYLYLESTRPDWKIFYKRNAKFIESRLKSSMPSQWSSNYLPQN